MNLTYEEAYKKLSMIVDKLQQDSTSLDESIELFKEGVELQKHCAKLLEEAEEKVAQVIKEDGSIEEFIHERDEK